MSVDYHIHTGLCGHARGLPGEYIETAIKMGLSEIGFSDHAPLPPEMRDGITMREDQAEYYIGMIEGKRDEYDGRIQVRLGFEVDYPLFDSFDRRYLSDARLDYLTGSCHFLDGWAFDHPDHIDGYSGRDIDKIYSDYYDIIGSMASSGLFNIIAHFDLVKKFGYRSRRDFTGTVEGIAGIIAAGNTAVEISTSGMRKPVGEIYPSDEIIGIFFRMNVPVTLGSDSHSPGEVASGFPHALEKIKSAGYRKISGFSKRIRYDIAL
jgi:histidinol-phosphatase (PHP family)